MDSLAHQKTEKHVMGRFFISQSFDDFELFSEQTGSWEVDFLLLKPKKFSANLTYFGDNDVIISDIDLGNHLHQRGASPKGYYTFAVHHPDSQPHKWRLLNCPCNSIAFFPENNELQSVSVPGFHTFTISIRESLFTTVANELQVSDFCRLIKQGDVTICDEKKLRCLQSFLQALCYQASQSKLAKLHYVLNEDVKWILSKMILDTLAHSKGCEPTKKQIHYRNIATRVLEHIGSDISRKLSLAELCEVGWVTERSLRNVFYEIFSTSPSSYVKKFRLSSARKMLFNEGYWAKPIVEIANKNSFWHMGQFAKDYKILFGELPSETRSKLISTIHPL